MGIGGAQRLVVDQLNLLNKDRFDPCLVTLKPEDKESFLEEVELPTEKIVYIDFPAYSSIRSWIKLIRWIRSEKFDIVFCHLMLANTAVRVAARIAGVKNILVAEHNLYPTKRRIDFFVDRILAHVTRRILAVSHDTKSFLTNRAGINSAKIEVLYNGIAVANFEGLRDERVSLRNKFHFVKDEVIIVSVGRASIQKGYDILIDTAVIVVEKNKKRVRFVVVGKIDTDYGKTLKARAHRLGLDAVVEFWGIRDDVAEILAAADIFFTTSRWEGFGIVLIEAMASGLPFVANDVGVVSGKDREVNHIEDGVHGLVVTKFDPEFFAPQLIQLIEDDARRREMGEMAHRKAQYFSLRHNVEELEKICCDIQG